MHSLLAVLAVALSAKLAPSFDVQDFEVRDLLDERRGSDGSTFRVRWKGWPQAGFEDTDEPEENLPAQLVSEFREAQEARKREQAKQNSDRIERARQNEAQNLAASWGDDPEAKDKDGNTAMIWAALNGDWESVQVGGGRRLGCSESQY